MASLRPLQRHLPRPSHLSTVRPVVRQRASSIQRCVGPRASHSTHSTTVVSRQWITRGRVLSIITYSTISYLAIKYVVGRFVDVDVEVRVGADARDDKAQDEEDEGEEGDEDEEGIFSVEDDEASFVSLQFPKKLPTTFYKSSDPEWQQFMKLSHDKERKEAIRKDIAEKVAKSAVTNPRLAARLGEEVKWTRLWLDFVFPDSPPPEYMRQGIIVLEDGLGLTTQVMPHADFQQLTSILYPSAVFTAMKNSLNLFYMMQKIRVKQLFGQELNEKERRTNLALKIAKMRLEVEDGDESSSPVQPPPVADPKAEKLGPPDEGSRSARQPQASMFGLTETLERAKSLPMAIDATIISRLFMTSLAHNWQRAKLNKQPPGCCYIHGDVELQGQRGRAKVHVYAAYDPRAGKAIWVQSNAAHVWSLKQAPRGGS